MAKASIMVILALKYKNHIAQTMSALTSLFSDVIKGCKLLPSTAVRPALWLLWVKNALKLQIIFVVILTSLLFITPTISSKVADKLYPPTTKSFGKRIAALFKSSKAPKPSLRDARYQQFQIGFWLIGSSGIFLLFILDLPRLRRLGDEQATLQLQQADSIKHSNPELSRSLTLTAHKLLSAPIEQANYSPLTPHEDENTEHDLTTTYTGPTPMFNGPRFVGNKQRYRIDKTLASGGAGIVYAGLDTTLERPIALKELFDDVANDPEQAERFQIEAKAMAAFHHPNIVPVYDMFEEDGHFWLVMELLNGGDLSTRIKSKTNIEVDECLNIIKGIAEGLAFAHDKGFVHRDIKPENILFADDGSFRITDFGIAKNTASHLKTQQGIILGSPGYMSPEQASGEALDLRSDIYSLGVTLYHMLTGYIPFEGETSQVLIKHITQQPEKPSTKNPDIPEKVDAIVMKMLEKKPKHRYQSALEVVEACG